jgi:stalled ribosome alternative rescue factor ArfA
MRAAKMMCGQRKKPIALKKGGNPVAKSLAGPALKPKVVKPKKGKGAYTRKGKALSYASGGAAVRSSGKKMLESIRSRTPKTGEKAKARMEDQKKYVEEQNKKAPRTMKSGGKTKSTVNKAGNYTKPTMRKNLFNKIKAGGKGGNPGQWSARKAQMLAQQYKKAGGGYRD